ncbi:MAG: helix-turn-helix domain-containing protein [Acutalibacter sp.]|nr:helix-turn-helix domain-containing protein [Acutalibacter sp.]
MNEIQIFEHEAYGQIRVIDRDGEPWFVAADVCKALELGNSRQAIARLDDDEKGVISIDTPGGPQEMSIINEPGLYTLVLGSRKPEAKAFKRWITHEVLPAIRQTGSYSLVTLDTNTNQRALTSDDYLRAAVIVARCKNDRLPYVLGFLEKGGWEIPKIQDTQPERQPVSVLVNRTLAESGLTMKQLAKLTGLGRVTLYRYKNGETEPRPNQYDHVASVLNGVIPTYKEEIE